MSIHHSLKIKGALSRHRNVLKRSERVEQLLEEEKWEQGDSVLGLPKVSHRKSHASKKVKEEALEQVAEATAEGTPASEGSV